MEDLKTRGPYKRYLTEDLDGIPDSTYRSRRKKEILQQSHQSLSTHFDFEIINADTLNPVLLEEAIQNKNNDSELFKKDLKIIHDNLEINPKFENEKTNDVLQEMLCDTEESNNFEFERNIKDESDSEEEDISYCADEVFAITAEDYALENEVRIPMYENCLLTKEESEVILLAQALRYGFTDSALESNLHLIDCHLPRDIHGSKYNFFQSFPNPQAKEYYYCSNCLLLLNFDESEITNCAVCNVEFQKSAQRKLGHYFLYSPLKEQLIQFVNSKYFKDMRKENVQESDIVNGQMYRSLRENNSIGDNDITIQWNTDGIKTFNSSKRSIWGILVQINELPYRLRKENMMCCGIWFSSEKPPMNLFLKPFIEELRELHNTGFQSSVFSHEEPVTIKVHALLSPVDSPAKCAIQNTKQYNGSHGCNYCLHPGEELPFGDGFHRVYPGDKREARTFEQHIRDLEKVVNQTEFKDINGVKGPSVVLRLPLFHIIWSFPPEAMHNVFEGVTKMLTDVIFDSKNHDKPWYLGRKVKEMDNLLLNIKPPSEVTRCPHSIKQHVSWKASEWKNFLLYYSLVCYKELLPKKYYQHWFLLVYSIHIFMKMKIEEAEFATASKAIKIFVLKIESLYGKDYMSYNVHLLLHIAHCIKLFGALWGWSTFPYEGYNGVLKGLFKGTQYVPDQILKSYARLKYLKLSASVFNKPGCSLKGKALFQSLMKECGVKRAVQFGENLTVFSTGQEFILTDVQKLLIQEFLKEEIEIEVSSYDRFIYNHTLFHSSLNKKLRKRLNCVITTVDGKFVSITALLRIKTLRGTYAIIVLGKSFQEENEIVCKHKNFSSSSFSTIVRESNNIVVIGPEMIGNKCICIPFCDKKFCLLPLVNTVETD